MKKLSQKKQQGMSTISLLLVLVGVGFLLMVVFKIGPLYLDNYFVKSSVGSLQDDDIHRLSKNKIRSALGRYFLINGIRDIPAADLKIERTDKSTKVMLDYEKRINFISNLDVVVKFENHYDTADN